MTQPGESVTCPDCGHGLGEHGESGCTRGYHVEPHDDLARAYEVCTCRRGPSDPGWHEGDDDA
jgi:hypothetical protein